MITSITIANTASYTGEAVTIGPLKALNYFFGGNGSGKTTLSRVLEKPNEYADCQVSWAGGTPLRALVYNCDFVRDNFAESGDVPGVFTLGQGNVTAEAQIKTTREEIEELDKKLKKARGTLKGPDGEGGKQAEMKARFEQFKTECWTHTATHRQTFSEAFKGYKTKKTLATQLVEESKRNHTSSPGTLSELQVRAEVIFGDAPSREQALQPLVPEPLMALSRAPLLAIAIVAKENVDLGGLVKKLGNSDWMQTGLSYVTDADGVCPFCQQGLPATLQQQLGDLFDERFSEQQAELQSLQERYSTAEAALRTAAQRLVSSEHRLIDQPGLTTAWSELQHVLERNAGRLQQKRTEPSRVISLDDIEPFIHTINAFVRVANTKIIEHNRQVDNIATERTQLTAAVWRFLAEDLKSQISSYRNDVQRLFSAITGLQAGISQKEGEIRAKEAGIRTLEQTITSTRPTVDRINRLLKDNDFHSFHLVSSNDETAYRLVRDGDATDATKTLSEGERTFVSFLYFFHLAHDGNNQATGTTDPRIVVFDDPISSLDSNVLFIVSAMVQRLASQILNGDTPLKQLLLLTHNTYFYKEVTYGHEPGKRTVTYWTVRKTNKRSSVTNHDKNPVMTTYERLWDEVKRASREDVPPVTVRNTMRRILEHYFKLLGGQKLHNLADTFQGPEKVHCRSLIKWAHDGSHEFFDDASYTLTPEELNTHLLVFKKIFEKTDHSAHYNMMMDEPSDASA